MGSTNFSPASTIGGFTGTQSNQNASNGGTQQTIFSPQAQQAIQQAQGQMSPLVQQLINQAGQYNTQAQGNANAINTNFGPNQVALSQQFQTPNFNQGLDATAQNLMSTQQAQNQAQTQAGAQQVARQMGQNNPGASQILQQQTKNAGNLANNPLAFGAAQEQQQRLLNQANVANQAQQMGNTAQLQQSQQNSGLQQLANQAQLQQQQGLQNALGFSAAGLGGAQNNLATQLGLGQAMGQQVSNAQQQAHGKGGGIFS